MKWTQNKVTGTDYWLGGNGNAPGRQLRESRPAICIHRFSLQCVTWAHISLRYAHFNLVSRLPRINQPPTWRSYPLAGGDDFWSSWPTNKRHKTSHVTVDRCRRGELWISSSSNNRQMYPRDSSRTLFDWYTRRAGSWGSQYPGEQRKGGGGAFGPPPPQKF